MGENFYKNMFLAGALWNILGGGFILAATNWIFSTAGQRPPQPPFFYDAWIALFVTFGIGYYMVYRDMYRRKDIVILGIIGKLAFTGVFAYNLLAYPRQVPLFFLIPVLGDLVFVVLFWIFLNFARRERR